MDARTRWETEALRDGTGRRSSPPKPSQRRTDPTRRWVTLREAEAATGIPANTLRKWARRSSLPSYLESDGEMAVRLVDLDAVVAHATSLGREIRPADPDPDDVGNADEARHGEAPGSRRVTPDAGTPGPDAAGPDENHPDVTPPGTMIVPVDAWNKMLTQLGNLHEAGQQLAEARERAAKAETEVTFLRQRLAELRTTESEPAARDAEPVEEAPTESDITVEARVDPPATTTYWRYVTAGWRHRTRRRRGGPPY